MLLSLLAMMAARNRRMGADGDRRRISASAARADDCGDHHFGFDPAASATGTGVRYSVHPPRSSLAGWFAQRCSRYGRRRRCIGGLRLRQLQKPFEI